MLIETVQSRSPIKVQFDVIVALYKRELKTRFGVYRLGWLWAILEPLLFVSVLSIMFDLRGKTNGLGNAEFPVFVMTGIVPLLLFRNGVKSGLGAVQANKGLFSYPMVRPFSSILARLILEFSIYLSVLVILSSGFTWLGYQAVPTDLPKVTASLLSVTFLAWGVGLILCAVRCYMESITKVWAVVTMPLMIISGAVVPILQIVPSNYHHWLTWNPVLHALELLRQGWIEQYPIYVDGFSFLLLSALSVMFVGMVLYRLNWQKMVSS
ncbi:transport permease protein [Agarivorans sp. OAG1]|uniref:ABC transporter permease n=1 Tax=Agarivorans sp. OAG1 TaxID=3082387 RepID=UPI002B2FC617|nr:transport permease protein [Agarivorans sp. OAG1]